MIKGGETRTTKEKHRRKKVYASALLYRFDGFRALKKEDDGRKKESLRDRKRPRALHLQKGLCANSSLAAEAEEAHKKQK